MVQVFIKYNPYKLQTEILVNGNELPADSGLRKVVSGKRLQEWVGKFPQMLKSELNTVDLEVEFKGTALDYDDFQDAFNQAMKRGQMKNVSLKFIQGKNNEDVNDEIVRIFNDLQEGPVADFKDEKLKRAFNNINNSEFPINVVATMSSGKSTLVNALLGNRLMPSENRACTATITEILDNDENHFEAVAYDIDGNIIEKVDDLTYEIMDRLNKDDNVYRIAAKGDIPFLDAKSTALKIVDTPGPNNSQNQEHKNTTYRAINNDSNNLILYVLNGTQLGTNDDAALLSYVADQMKEGGKQVRDRFLFVINKMDGFDPEQENIENAVEASRQYLAKYGITDPQIFPCSAFTALNLRTCLKNVDIDNLTRKEERLLPSAAGDTLPMIDKFNGYDQMHLEQYSTLAPSAQSRINYELDKAVQNNDSKATALIHCGIRSLEEAITAYVKKYARTKKIKDLVESFREVLDSNQVLAKVKTRIATSESAAQQVAQRAAAVKEQLADGKQASEFKERINDLDPMPSIEDKAEELLNLVDKKTMEVFSNYGETITKKEDAKRLIDNFAQRSSDSIAQITAELDSAIGREIIDAGRQLLDEYQAKLMKFDDRSKTDELDFDTADLIKGALANMQESAEQWRSDEFIAETVDDYGETTEEVRTYYEKTGQVEELVADGTEQVKIGTKIVTKTKPVLNPKKYWFTFWRPKYIEQDYEEEEDVYETQIKYKSVMRDVFEERTEITEKFSVRTADLQAGLVSELQQTLGEGINNALDYAKEQIAKMKSQFSNMFDELDELIDAKYTELEKCAGDQKTKEHELEENRRILEWIETCSAEIEEALEI